MRKDYCKHMSYADNLNEFPLQMLKKLLSITKLTNHVTNDKYLVSLRIFFILKCVIKKLFLYTLNDL